MLRPILTMALMLAVPAAAAAHSAALPHAHPHGQSYILGIEAALAALALAGVIVLVMRLAKKCRAARALGRRK